MLVGQSVCHLEDSDGKIILNSVLDRLRECKAVPVGSEREKCRPDVKR